jgi:hypothetical protein
VATLADLLIKIGIKSDGVDQGANDVESKMEKTWGRVQAGAAAGGLLVGAALMAGIQQVIEQSKPMALLEAQIGGGSDLAADAGKAAGEVYAKGVVTSLEDATAAVKGVLLNALLPEEATKDEIADVANSVANLSTLMEEDAGRVSAAVSQMIRTGLVDSAQEGFDLLTRGVQQGVNKSEDLLDTFNEYGTQFRKIGADGPQALGMMSQALRAGARDSDTVADALKEFSIRAIDGSKGARDAYKVMGLSADDMMQKIAKGGPEANEGLQQVLDGLRAIKDPVKREAAAVGLFGTKAEDLGDALYAIDPKTAVRSLADVAGAADRAGDTLEQSAGAKLESFKRKALGQLTEQLAKMVPAVEATFGWFQRNSDWVMPLAIALGVLATALGIIVAVQWAWNAALLVSPITWIVAGIVLLVGLIVLLATKTRFFQTIWEHVWGFFKAIGAWFAGPFADFFVSLWKRITDSFTALKTDISNKINAVKAVFKALGDHVSLVWRDLIKRGTDFVSWVMALPGKLKSKLSSLFSPLWIGFKTAVNNIISGWNNLSFTVGGGSVMGVDIPSVTLSTPNIPMLAQGGIVTGPTLAMIGEGREAEAVVPLSRLPELAGREAATVVVEITPGGERDFRRWINKTVRVKGTLNTRARTA